MDYGEMISALEEYFEGKDLKHGDALKITDGIKTLLAERDAAIAEISKKCVKCKHYYVDASEYHPCEMRMNCIKNGSKHNWQWCGPQKHD